jgi:signal peptidase I
MQQIYRAGQSQSSKLPRITLLAVTLAALAGVAASRAFIGSVAVVDGPSMTPNYPSGARVYTVPISSPLERCDVVVLDDGNKEYAMKRIVGMPGETVQLWRGKVFINRKLLAEPYLPKHTYTCPIEHQAVFILGADQYFVLGDNRPCSADSRTYGPVNRGQVKRRIPADDGALHAEFRPFTLPAPGKSLIRPVTKPDARSNS